MNVLLVEDDEDKRQQLSTFIKCELSSTITEACSLQSGLRALLINKFDLVILDMSMPTFDITPTEDGGRPQPYAGREILQQMQRRGISSKVVVVTYYDRFGISGEETTLEELDKQLFTSFPNTYLGAIHYSIKYVGWQNALKNLLSSNGFKFLIS